MIEKTGSQSWKPPSRVTNPRKPKTRPPKSFRDKFGRLHVSASQQTTPESAEFINRALFLLTQGRTVSERWTLKFLSKTHKPSPILLEMVVTFWHLRPSCLLSSILVKLGLAQARHLQVSARGQGKLGKNELAIRSAFRLSETAGFQGLASAWRRDMAGSALLVAWRYPSSAQPRL